MTTTGEEFLVGAPNTRVTVEDFPSPGETTLLEWNQSTQHSRWCRMRSRPAWLRQTKRRLIAWWSASGESTQKTLDTIPSFRLPGVSYYIGPTASRCQEGIATAIRGQIRARTRGNMMKQRTMTCVHLNGHSLHPLQAATPQHAPLGSRIAIVVEIGGSSTSHLVTEGATVATGATAMMESRGILAAFPPTQRRPPDFLLQVLR